MSLLWLGANGWKQMLDNRRKLFAQLQSKLTDLSMKFGERLLVTKSNQISLGE